MAEPKERADLYRGVSHRLQFLLLHVGGIVDESADELGLCVHETGFPPYLHAGPIREAEFIPAMAQGILDSGRALRARVVAAVQPAAWIRQGFPARPADRIVRVCHTGDADRHVEGPERSGPRLADLRMAVVPDDRLRPADDHQSGCRQAEPGDQHQVFRARARILCDDDWVRTGANGGMGVGPLAAVSARSDARVVRGVAGVAANYF